MTISEHLGTFAGWPILDFSGDLQSVQTHGYRVRVDWDEEEGAWPGNEDRTLWQRKMDALLNLPAAQELKVLVTGATAEDEQNEAMQDAVRALLAAAPRLPALEGLFINDLTYEEFEISWLEQTSLEPLLAAYPRLRHLGVRGSGQGLNFGGLRLPALETLVVQSGGLPREVVAEVLAAPLPALRHLELYFGSENYGANTGIADLAPLLRGDLFPELRVLGLKNAEFVDEVAAALAQSPVLSRLEVLDLSLGMLTDEGAAALLESGRLSHLKTLNLGHHYLSPDMQARLRSALPAVGVLLDDPQDISAEWRSVAISE